MRLGCVHKRLGTMGSEWGWDGVRMGLDEMGAGPRAWWKASGWYDARAVKAVAWRGSAACKLGSNMLSQQCENDGRNVGRLRGC
jgi:hypothetical protein